MSMFSGGYTDKVTASVVVAQDGTGDYNGTTEECIQDAINSLIGTGGWVFTKPGTYNISDAIVIPSEQITLTGVFPGTILDAGANSTPIIAGGGGCFNYYLVIKDMVLKNGGSVASSDGVIELWDSPYSLIEHVLFEGSSYAGIGMPSSAVIQVNNNIFKDLDSGAYAIKGSNTSFSIISNNQVNSSGNGGGFYFETAKKLVISMNEMDVSDEGILLTGESKYNTLTTNNIDDCSKGISEEDTSDYNTFIGNVVQDATVEKYSGVGVHSRWWGNV